MSEALSAVNGTPEALLAVEQMAQDRKDLIRKTVAPDATPAELDLFIYDCLRRRTHPLDRLVHFTKRGGRYTPIVGIDYMRSLAAETNEHAGTDDVAFAYEPNDDKHQYPVSASVTVYRLTAGVRYPYASTARWSEYYPGDGGPGFMWRKMPHVMLAKVAEALALRKAFPRQLGGLYSSDELEQASREPRPKRSKSEATVVSEAERGREPGEAASPAAPNDAAPSDLGWRADGGPQTGNAIASHDSSVVVVQDPPGWMRVGGVATPHVWPPLDLVAQDVVGERKAAQARLRELGFSEQSDRLALYKRIFGREVSVKDAQGFTAASWRRVRDYATAMHTPPEAA